MTFDSMHWIDLDANVAEHERLRRENEALKAHLFNRQPSRNILTKRLLRRYRKAQEENTALLCELARTAATKAVNW